MAVFEQWGSGTRVTVPLEGTRLSLGKSSDSDLLIDDAAVSRHHAIVELVGSVWCIRDLGSLNGTLINGKPLFGERALRDGDEITLGLTRLVYRDRHWQEPETVALASPPVLTRREQEVLIELCRPVLSGSAFTAPAAVREIADQLFVTQAAVRQHLGHLFDKFDIPEEGREPRRIRLANRALQSGAVTVADLRGEPV